MLQEITKAKKKSHREGTRDGGLRSIKIIGKRKAKGRETRCYFDRLSMFCCLSLSLFPSIFKTFHHTNHLLRRHVTLGFKTYGKRRRTFPRLTSSFSSSCSIVHQITRVGSDGSHSFHSVAPIIRVLELFLIVRTAAAARRKKGKRAAARSLLYT